MSTAFRPWRRRVGLPAEAGLGPATFYADLAVPHERRHVRVCAATRRPDGCDRTHRRSRPPGCAAARLQ
ncbi:hypothetical protein ACWDRB_41120 [Nonomuraea sp. NPDC003707]